MRNSIQFNICRSLADTEYAINPGTIENVLAELPFEAVLVATGGALITRVAHRFIISGSVVLVASLAPLMISEVIPPLFGVGGGLITLFFLGSLWDWARTRPALLGSEKTGL